MLWLIPAATACTLSLFEGERAAFYAAIAQDIPDTNTPQDLIFEGWRVGLLPRDSAAEALAALLPASVSSEADARHTVMEAVVRDEEALGRVVGLAPWPAARFAVYEKGRRKGGCGGIGPYRSITLSAESPLAPYERQAEAISGWAWGLPTWDVALEGREIALQQGNVPFANELDALAVSILVQADTPAALSEYMAARCATDEACAGERRAAIRTAVSEHGSPWGEL